MSALKGCDARFVIEFDDLDAVLDETNTLIELQGALQEAAPSAVFFNAWNGNLMRDL